MKKEQESKYDAVDGKIVNRATGVAIPADEPIIIFRAQDIFAPSVLAFYSDLLEDGHHKDVVDRKRKDMMKWQGKNMDKMKEPDSDKSCFV